MLQKFNTYISSNNLFDKNSKLIAAVSGGIDSIVLCHLLHKSGFDFALAHCNFSLRAQESDQDEAFVGKLAKKYKVPFFNRSFQTTEFAEANKISIQMAARDLRYTWFEELINEYAYDRILTAHHKSDLAETVLLNLIRGTGISGLHGIKPLKGNLARPMLFAGREDIMAYVAEHQLAWREDSSNLNTKYNRNFLRQEVIPLLKNLNPGFETTIEETVEKVSAAEEIFRLETERIREQSVKKEKDYLTIDRQFFPDNSRSAIQLYEILQDFNFSYSQIKSMLNAEGSGKQFISSTHLLVSDRGKFVISRNNLSEYTSLELVNIPSEVSFDKKKITIRELAVDGYRINPDRNIAAVDADRLHLPLTVRKWKEGDWFIPLGMNKKKKLSDFFIDEKVPLNIKNNIRVIVSDGAIVYIPGMRIDDRFKLTDNTTAVAEIRFIP